jgi:hypothetical protein
MEDTTNRFLVEIDANDRDSVRIACRALVDVMGPVLHNGRIDGISDFPAQDLDPAALSALDQIRERAKTRALGRKRESPENLMGIELDLTKDEDLQILRAFGPWSINAEVYSTQRGSRFSSQDVLCFHDSGWDITAELTDDEAASLSSLLPSSAKLKRLEPPPSLFTRLFSRRRG